jgi:hypothetical protein
MRLASWDLRASALIRFSRSLRSWSALAVSENDRKYGEELAGLQSTRQVKKKPYDSSPARSARDYVFKDESASENKLAQEKRFLHGRNNHPLSSHHALR